MLFLYPREFCIEISQNLLYLTYSGHLKLYDNIRKSWSYNNNHGIEYGTCCISTQFSFWAISTVSLVCLIKQIFNVCILLGMYFSFWLEDSQSFSLLIIYWCFVDTGWSHNQILFLHELWLSICVVVIYSRQWYTYHFQNASYWICRYVALPLLNTSEVTQNCSCAHAKFVDILNAWYDKLLNIFIWIDFSGLTSKMEYFLHESGFTLGRFWRHSVCTKYLWYNPLKSCLFNLNCKVKY